MPDEQMLRIQRNKTQQLKFISTQLTPDNPQNVYYLNYEETFKTYLALILVGLLMLGYMVFY
jgi:hypothetical protein